MKNTYQSADSAPQGRGNRTTGAQRHNARQDKIWETYKKQEAEKEMYFCGTYFDFYEGEVKTFATTNADSIPANTKGMERIKADSEKQALQIFTQTTI